MTEADKDALLVRAALDIMAMQLHISMLTSELNETKSELISYCRMITKASKQVFATKESRHMSLDAAKRAHVVATYRAYGGRIDVVAERLGIQRRQLYNLLPVNILLERRRARESK